MILAVTRDAVRDAAQQRLVRGLVASGRPVLVLATGLPYDLGLFPGIRAAVASYSDSSVSLGAAAAVLAGRLPRPAGCRWPSRPRPGAARSATAPVCPTEVPALLPARVCVTRRRLALARDAYHRKRV